MTDWVTLDVGGTVFKTKRSTLELKDTLFATLIEKFEGTTLQLDRDPTYFRYILNYLRSPGLWVGPTSAGALKELATEGKYYCMPEAFFEKLYFKRVVDAKFSDPLSTKLLPAPGLLHKLTVDSLSALVPITTPGSHNWWRLCLPSFDLYLSHLVLRVYNTNEDQKVLVGQFMEDQSFEHTATLNRTYIGTHVAFSLNSDKLTKCLYVAISDRSSSILCVEIYGKAKERFV